MNQDNELIRKVQLKELEILKIFQGICKRHNLRYFAIGGTCLGAVRHQGFIPWDDDIDVAMPYEDYVKFLELAQTELPEGYVVLNEENSQHFSRLGYYSKIIDVRTTFIPKYVTYDDSFRGIFFDIAPVHGLPQNNLKRKSVLFLAYVYRKLNCKLRYPIWDTKSLKGFILGLLCLPLKFFLHYDFFTRMYKKMLKHYSFGCSDKIIFPWRNYKPNSVGFYRNVFYYSDFRDSLELPFEGTTISVPAGYDRYLTMDFGDYMKLPSEKERVNHTEGAIIDLDRPYTYYVQQKEAGKLCS